MKTTVFICTYNRGNLINGTLEALINNQTRNPNEIIVVNGGGENDCQKTLGKWQKEFFSLKIIKCVLVFIEPKNCCMTTKVI